MGKKISKYYLQSKIGQGASGIVYIAFDENKSLYAIKMYNKKTNFEKKQSGLINEIKLSSKINHNRIVKNFECFQTKTNSYLVMEFCNGGDLSDYIEENFRIEEGIVRIVTRQIVEGMNELFRNNIIHRDLKPKNIFIHYPNLLNKDINKAEIKIGDFGISVKVNHFENKTDFGYNQKCGIEGTFPYMAPEIINQNKFSIKSEIWSLGIIVYELVVGTIPFRGATRDEIKKKIEKGIYLIPRNINISNECIQFINSCLQYDPSNRISWENVINHGFISDNRITLNQALSPHNYKYLYFSIYNKSEALNFNLQKNKKKEEEKLCNLLTNNTILENSDQDEFTENEEIFIRELNTIMIYSDENESNT